MDKHLLNQPAPCPGCGRDLDTACWLEFLGIPLYELVDVTCDCGTTSRWESYASYRPAPERGRRGARRWARSVAGDRMIELHRVTAAGQPATLWARRTDEGAVYWLTLDDVGESRHPDDCGAYQYGVGDTIAEAVDSLKDTLAQRLALGHDDPPGVPR